MAVLHCRAYRKKVLRKRFPLRSFRCRQREVIRMRKNSIKHIRVNEEVLRELSEIIRSEIKDPRIHMMTSVSGVDLATDLKTCKVYISVLGSEQEKADTMEGLKSASGYIRKCLAKSLNLRNTPELIFLLDQSIEYGVAMTRKIDELAALDARNAADSGYSADPAGEDLAGESEAPEEGEEA